MSPVASLLRYHKYKPTEIPIIIAPDPATVPAIFILFEDSSAFGSTDGVGEALKLTSKVGDFVASEELDPKTDDVFWEDVLEVPVDGEFLGEGLCDFALVDVEDEDCDVEL